LRLYVMLKRREHLKRRKPIRKPINW